MLKSRLETFFKSEDDYVITEEFLGYQLKGEEYEPIFPYYAKVSCFLCCWSSLSLVVSSSYSTFLETLWWTKIL